MTGIPRIFFVAALLAAAAGCVSEHRAGADPSTVSNANYEYAININTATLDELQRIPYVGEKLAEKIVEHRKVNGPFRRVEHLMLIQGISDARFRKIRPLVRVE